MTAEKDSVAKLVDKLVARMKSSAGALDMVSLDLPQLIQRLASQYPGDVGIFCVFFLNVLELQPGEAIFLEANLPHAYLLGDCLECMAQSDNVVRAGLTPKLRDTNVLCEMLNYKLAGPPKVIKGDASNAFPKTRSYRPPIDEFALQVTSLGSGESQKLPMNHDTAPSILLVYEGAGKLDNGLAVQKGSVIFVGAKRGSGLQAQAGDAGLKVARCHATIGAEDKNAKM